LKFDDIYFVFEVLLVITDGQSNSGVSSVKKEADLLKKDFVNIFAVGAGSNVNNKELEAIASSSDHVIRISSISALQSILSIMHTAICKGQYFCIGFIHSISLLMILFFMAIESSKIFWGYSGY
jgi:von Willebrand factor type A domain.